MARRPDLNRLQQLYCAIQEYPGERPAFFARLLGWHRSEVIRALPALEEQSFLLSEDSEGRLWPFPGPQQAHDVAEF